MKEKRGEVGGGERFTLTKRVMYLEVDAPSSTRVLVTPAVGQITSL